MRRNRKPRKKNGKKNTKMNNRKDVIDNGKQKNERRIHFTKEESFGTRKAPS